MRGVDKPGLVEQIVAQLAHELATLAAAAAVAQENATSTEAKAEGQFDTRALESSYLAEGQARRAAEVRGALAAFHALAPRDFAPGEPIALGALVELEQRGRRDCYFLGPQAGGLELAHDGCEVLVITPQSPLGRKLLGKAAGAVVSVDAAHEARIVAVH